MRCQHWYNGPNGKRCPAKATHGAFDMADSGFCFGFGCQEHATEWRSTMLEVRKDESVLIRPLKEVRLVTRGEFQFLNQEVTP